MWLFKHQYLIMSHSFQYKCVITVSKHWEKCQLQQCNQHDIYLILFDLFEKIAGGFAPLLELMWR